MRKLSVQLILMIFAVGVSFAFASVIFSIAHATWKNTPSGVQPLEYFSLGLRSFSGDYSPVSLYDLDAFKAFLPESALIYERVAVIEAQNPAGSSQQLVGRAVSANYFDVMGVTSELGQLAPHSAGDRAVVISFELWQQWYQPGETVLGDFLRDDNGIAVPIVGIANRQFSGIGNVKQDFWLFNSLVDWTMTPVIPGMSREDNKTLSRYVPNVSVFGVISKSDLPLIVDRIGDFRFTSRSVNIGGITFQFSHSAQDSLYIIDGLETAPKARELSRERIILLAATVPLVLGISFVTFVSFLFSGSELRNEFNTIRVALGATRKAIFLQVVLDNAFWVAVIASVALLATYAIGDLVVSIEPFGSYLHKLSASDIAIGLATSFALLVVASVISFAYVAWHVSKYSLSLFSNRTLSNPVKYAAAAGRIILFSICSICLVAIFLIIHQYVIERTLNAGFSNTKAVLVQANYKETSTSPDVLRAQRRAIFDGILRDSRAKSVAAATSLPFSSTTLTPVSIRSDSTHDLVDQLFFVNSVTSDFYTALGVVLIAGQFPDKTSNNHLAISLAAANKLAANPVSALGLTMAFDQGVHSLQGVVTGVVADIPYGDYTAEQKPIIYENMSSTLGTQSNNYWVVDIDGGVSSLSDIVLDLDLNNVLGISKAAQAADVFRDQFIAQKSVEVVVAIAAVFATMLSIVAVSNIVARQINDNRSIIGVKFALGAKVNNVVADYLGGFLRDIIMSTISLCAIMTLLAHNQRIPPAPQIVLGLLAAIITVTVIWLIASTILIHRIANGASIIEVIGK